eukprot:4783270-Pleurochrysis_carterae.AAC.2
MVMKLTTADLSPWARTRKTSRRLWLHHSCLLNSCTLAWLQLARAGLELKIRTCLSCACRYPVDVAAADVGCNIPLLERSACALAELSFLASSSFVECGQRAAKERHHPSRSSAHEAVIISASRKAAAPEHPVSSACTVNTALLQPQLTCTCLIVALSSATTAFARKEGGKMRVR